MNFILKYRCVARLVALFGSLTTNNFIFAQSRKMASAEPYLVPMNSPAQVRSQSKRAESELEEVRQNTARIETEKAVLEERVEVEGAERVTVVASVSHERDFLLRQASA